MTLPEGLVVLRDEQNDNGQLFADLNDKLTNSTTQSLTKEEFVETVET
jgi:hypothetical protein